MVKSYAAWIVRFRWLIVLATILVVGGLSSGGRFLTFTNDYRVFFSDENPQMAAFDNLQATYTKNDNVLIMLEPKDGNVFTNATLAAVEELTEAAWQVPFSRRVDSISNFQHTYAEEDDLIVEDLVTEAENLTAEEIDKIRNVAISEPALLNKLVSPSGHTTGINITVEIPGIDQKTEIPQVVEHARNMIAEFEAKHPDIKVYYTGVAVMNQAFSEASFSDMATLVPLAFVIIILGMMIFLRSLLSTIASLLVIIFSITTAMGIAGWMGIALTPPTVNAPTLILTLAVADCVHLLSSMLHNLRRGEARQQAVIEALRINFHPILLTSVTTAIGFMSMNFSDSPPFRDLGNITAIGVLAAFVLSVSFLPALMCILPLKPSEKTTGQTALMDKFGEWVLASRKQLFVVMSAIIIFFTAMIPLNEINDKFVEYFDTSIPFRTHSDHIADNLSGLYFIDYSFSTDESGGISEPDFQKKIDNFVEWAESQEVVQHVSTITDTMRRLNKNMHADEQTWYKLPEQRDLAAQYLLLYEMSLPYGLDLNNQINVDKSATRVSITLKTIPTSEVLAFQDSARTWMQNNIPAFVTEGSSPTVMFSHIGMRNIESMLTGTIIALVVISMILIFALRNLRLGFLSLIPNLVPAGVAFGLWGLMVGQVGLSVSVVATMTLGIVVDDTIHFLSKYLRARREQGLSPEDAIRYAFHTVGVALFITTVILAAGFMILAQSAFELNSSMGLLTASTIVIALIIDFLFLPPLLLMVEKKK